MPEKTVDKKELSNFPPKSGELMMRRMFRLGREDQWELDREELQYFDQVGQPGENWHYQKIAEKRYGNDPAQPSFGSGTDSATDGAEVAWDSYTKVVHSHATQGELESYVGQIKGYFDNKQSGSGDRSLQLWAEQVTDSPSLQPGEKTRIKLACTKIIGK